MGDDPTTCATTRPVDGTSPLGDGADGDERLVIADEEPANEPADPDECNESKYNVGGTRR
jgi:hypothetical protein